MDPTAGISDPEQVLASDVVFRIDPDDLGWYVGRYCDRNIYLRLNNFPEENAYSLWLGHGRWFELEDLPEGWTIDRSDRRTWPESARPRRPRKHYT